MSASYVPHVRSTLERYGDERGYTFVREGAGGLVEEHVTYREIDERARQIAEWLGRRLSFGSRLLLVYPAGLDFLPAFLGCLYAGMVAVPMPLARTRAGQERTSGILTDSGAELVLTDAKNIEGIRDMLAAERSPRPIACEATDAEPLGDAARWRRPEELDDAVAFLQYTSGSTSDPKGVVVTHANLGANQRELTAILDTGPETVMVSWLPHFHDMGLMGGLLVPLWSGARCVLMSPTHFIKRPLHWLQTISRHRGTVTMAPNFAYDLCVRRVPTAEVANLDLSSLRTAVNGAEPVRARTVLDFTEHFRAAGFRLDAYSPGFGLAEATLSVTAVRTATAPTLYEVDPAALARHRAEPAIVGAGMVLVGCGVPFETEVRIVDTGSRQELPAGHVGEIWARGDGIAKGYWNRPDATRETFEARTAAGDGPFLRTGDLGFLRAGELFVTGRLRDMIIVQGRNLYPQDIERVGAAAHPDLDGRMGAAFSVGDEAEHVVIVQEMPAPRPGGTPPRELALAIRQAIVEAFDVSLPSVVLVRSGVPRTTSGKVRRRHAREMLLGGEFAPVHEEAAPALRNARRGDGTAR